MQLGLAAFTAALGACTAGAKWEALCSYAFLCMLWVSQGLFCELEFGLEGLQGCLGDSVFLLLSDTNAPSCSRIGLKRSGEG